jgi:hypothetical protein
MSEKELSKNFIKILKDFCKDLLTTFPEYIDVIKDNKELTYILNNDSDENDENYKSLKEYCLKIYPERFFDILYKNEKIFQEDNNINCYFIPNIDFKEIWRDNISDNTKKIIWQYLQLILFNISKMVDGAESFGDATKLFEAINENELFNKLEETIKNMESVFDVSNINLNETMDISNMEIPDPNEIHSHIKDLLEGNLGKLAHEIAEETAKDLEDDFKDLTSVGDVFQKLFKNPTKLMGMIQKVGTRLDEKIKSGEIKESELMQEASDLMSKMTNMPGMKNMEQIFSQMGVPMGKNSKMKMNSIQSNLKKNIRMSKQRERMLAKLEQRRNMLALKKQNETHSTEYVYSKFTDENGIQMKKSSVKKKKKKRKNRNKNKNKK